MKILSLLPLLFSLLVFSCEKSSPEKIEVQESESIWKWEEFTLSDEIILSPVSVQLQTREQVDILAPIDTTLTLVEAVKKRRVKKDEEWAHLDLEEIREQEEELTLKNDLQELAREKSLKIDDPQAYFALLEELKEARKKVAAMEAILESEVGPELAKTLGMTLGEVEKSEMVKARQLLVLLEEKVAFAEKNREPIRLKEERLREMELEKARRQLADAKKNSILTAPFSGELRVHLPLEDELLEHEVRLRQLIASFTDYSAVLAPVPITRAAWLETSPEQFYLVLKNRSQTRLNFHDEGETTGGSRTTRLKSFVFITEDEDEAEKLQPLLGASFAAELRLKLSQPCRIVGKNELAFHASGNSSSRDWSSLVSELWPDRELAVEGMNSLAITEP